MSAIERYEASRALHAEKESSGAREHMSYRECWAGCKNGQTHGDGRSPRRLSLKRSALDAREARAGPIRPG
jgi:hypothetical protein